MTLRDRRRIGPPLLLRAGDGLVILILLTALVHWGIRSIKTKKRRAGPALRIDFVVTEEGENYAGIPSSIATIVRTRSRRANSNMRASSTSVNDNARNSCSMRRR
jgi:hypothetical protein